MTAADTTVVLPYITVQHDFASVEADVSDGTVTRDSCWASCYPAHGHGVHGKVCIERDGHDQLSYTAYEGIQISHVTSTAMLLGCPSLDVPPTRVRRPKQSIIGLHENGVDTLDISPTDSCGLSTGGQNGSLKLGNWSASYASTAIEATGFVGDVTDIRFFPSGEVLLVACSDMRVRIFGIQGTNPRTFLGHARSVEACMPLPPKGRLVLTASQDATVKLWRVADSLCLHTFRLHSAVNDIDLGKRPTGFEGGLRLPDGDDGEAARHHDREELEEGVLALVALTSGGINVLDVSSRTLLDTLSTNFTSPALSIAYHSSTGLVATGHGDGTIVLQRLGSSDSSPLVQFRRATCNAVNSLVFSAPWPPSKWPTLLVAGDDGLPFRAAFDWEGDEGARVHVVEEFMGLDTDPATCIREGPGGIFAASKDGCVRRW